MKSLLFILLLAQQPVTNTANAVYVCDGPKIKKYHLTNTCRGLRGCQHKIVRMLLEDAQKSGKTLCAWEK